MVTRPTVAAILIMLLVGCSEADLPFISCEVGDGAAREGRFGYAVEALSTCLSLPFLPDSTRARALQARAWSHFNERRHRAAVEDQEEAFKLKRPSEYHEFINYASYLRKIGRFEDSLTSVLAAEATEKGDLSMMTQYNKGWSLLELGRHKEAVEAFTKGVPAQPDYAFVYWRRGLAYEGLGSKDLAIADFERCAQLLISKNDVAAAGELLPAIREKLRRYGLDQRYTL